MGRCDRCLIDDSLLASLSSALRLRFAAKSDVIVEVDEIEPGLHVLAFLRKLADVLREILKGFHVSARAAALHETTPGVYLPCGPLRFRVRVYPYEDLPVALAIGEFLLQCGKVEPDEFLEVLIHRCVVIEFSVLPSDHSPPFVEQTRENDVSAETAAWTPRRTLSEIRCANISRVGHRDPIIGFRRSRSKNLLLSASQFGIPSLRSMKSVSRYSAT